MRIVQETLLAFHMEEEKFLTIRRVCSSLGIKAVKVAGEQENAPLGLLAGARDWMNPLLMRMADTSHPITEEMLVMAGFSDPLLELFLARLRQCRAGVSLKAILTDRNVVWNGGQLQEELKRERAAFSKSTGIE